MNLRRSQSLELILDIAERHGEGWIRHADLLRLARLRGFNFNYHGLAAHGIVQAKKAGNYHFAPVKIRLARSLGETRASYRHWQLGRSRYAA